MLEIIPGINCQNCRPTYRRMMRGVLFRAKMTASTDRELQWPPSYCSATATEWICQSNLCAEGYSTANMSRITNDMHVLNSMD